MSVLRFMGVFFTLTFVVSAVFAKTEEAHDFRRVDWGFSVKEVEATEKGDPLDRTDNAIIYKGKVANLDCIILYNFFENELYSTAYFIKEKYSNKNQYISEYEKLHKLLQQKYGTPLEDEIVWKNSLYKDEPERWGMAVSTGHLLYFSTWKTPKTEIGLILSGNNFDIDLGITYESLKHAEKVKKALDKDTLNDL